MEIPASDSYEVLFGEPKLFKYTFWKRYTIEDGPDWEAKNQAWDERPTMWYMPLNWDNYVDM